MINRATSLRTTVRIEIKRGLESKGGGREEGRCLQVLQSRIKDDRCDLQNEKHRSQPH